MDGKRWLIISVFVLLYAVAFAAETITGARDSPPPLFKDPAIGLEMVYVKGGCYEMGAADDDCDGTPEERPAHEVCVDDYYMGKYEVTQGQWKMIMGSNTAALSTCKEETCPVDNVNWSDMQEFISRLNKRSGGGRYRLPTEAEWEYAARSGGKREIFSGGKDLDKVAWYAENSGKINHPVGTKAPNSLGIYDMSGNVWEMTNDLYAGDYYARSPRMNPTGPASGLDRVLRGGCRTGGIVNQRTVRRVYVYDRTGSDRGGNVGFRLLKEP